MEASLPTRWPTWPCFYARKDVESESMTDATSTATTKSNEDYNNGIVNVYLATSSSGILVSTKYANGANKTETRKK